MAQLKQTYARALEWARGRCTMGSVAVCVALTLFALMLLGRGNGALHGSSIGEWNRILPDAVQGYRGDQLGYSRSIRSDEWATSTPFVLAQCASKEFFPRINRNINGGTDMFLETPCAPVWDLTAIGQFHNWGYFLFGAERGLAWSWWTRYLLLPLFAFLFLLKWCEGDALVAAAGAAAITFGAPTQWWDTTVPLHLAYFFASLVFAGSLFSCRSIWGASLCAVALAVSLASFLFVMYMPFTILLVPSLLLLLGWQIREAREGHVALRFALFAAVLAAVGALFAYFYVIHSEALGIIMSSAYPGKRAFHGGSLAFFCDRSVLDLVSVWATEHLPVARLNECQAAEYIGFYLPSAILIAWAFLKRQRVWFAFALLANATLLYAWCAFPLTPSFAKLCLLSSIPPARATIIAGFLVLLAALRLVRARNPSPALPRVAVFFALALFVAARAFAFSRSRDMWLAIYSSGRGILELELAAILLVGAVYGFLCRRRALFACCVIVFSLLTACGVHPLVEGISPLRDKYLTRVVKQVDGDDPGVWMSNDRCVSQLFAVAGLRCNASTQQYCDRRFWEIVDAEGRYENVWNRYAHRFLVDLEGKTVPTNRSRPDTIFYSLDEGRVRRLGVKYIVWRGSELNLPWLEHLRDIRNDHIYRVKRETAATTEGENHGQG